MVVPYSIYAALALAWCIFHKHLKSRSSFSHNSMVSQMLLSLVLNTIVITSHPRRSRCHTTYLITPSLLLESKAKKLYRPIETQNQIAQSKQLPQKSIGPIKMTKPLGVVGLLHSTNIWRINRLPMATEQIRSQIVCLRILIQISFPLFFYIFDMVLYFTQCNNNQQLAST